MRFAFLLLAVLSLGLGRPAEGAEEGVLQLRWDHQFQFAGYYAALWQGYYAEAGLDVEIRPPCGRTAPSSMRSRHVRTGVADFGVGAADILIGASVAPS